MSDTRHLADLKFDERPLTRSSQSRLSLHSSAAPQTDMMMLQKADVWMSQFKSRLNLTIISLVVLWGAVSYFKSTDMQLAAHAVPEVEHILADGSMDESTTIPVLEVDSMQREMSMETVEAVETVEAESKVSVDADARVAPASTVKKGLTQKSAPKKAKAGKSASRNQKKLKKSVAAKPAS
jgi:hypothetical protein